MLVAVAFAALTVAATWPLVPNLGRSLPSDLGDPLFVTWVMAWVARHLTALAGGDLGAFARMWNAPIFAPEPLTLAYSEHFTAQALLTLPVGWLGGTPIAAYNIAFLGSFWLSALGSYVLVRVMTGRPDAALVAGVCYGFNAYRAFSLPHLHTLSAQWVPLALAAVIVFARRGSVAALGGAAAAVVLTAWSSVYYLAFFMPVMLIVGGATLLEHDGWRRRRSAIALAIALIAVAAAVVPFLLPYRSAQATLGVVRPRAEVEMYSLTLDTYLASGWQLVPMLVLAATALLLPAATRSGRRVTALYAATAVTAFWLSLGPTPRWSGEPFGLPGLYALLLDHVPGFSGLRVASRYAMVLMFALSVLAGLGVAAFGERRRRAGLALAAVGIVAQLAHYWQFPLPLHAPLGTGSLRAVPAYLDPAAPPAPIYAAVARLDPTAVVVELPFGEPAYELRYMAAGLAHGRRLLNGYSGVFPPSYRARLPVLSAPWNDAAAAWAALSPATHAVVHAEAWAPAQADSVQRWLSDGGARRMAVDHGASLWELPPRP